MARFHARLSAWKWQIRYEFPFALGIGRRNRPKSFRFGRFVMEDLGQPLPRPRPDRPDIYVWSIIDWHFRFQRPQHLAVGLARRGHRVFYISEAIDEGDEPGFSVEHVADGVVLVRLRTRAPASICDTAPSEADALGLAASVGRLVAWANSESCISVVQHPFWRRFAMPLPNGMVVADVLDLLTGFEGAGVAVAAEEDRLLRSAHLTVVSAAPLLDHVRPAAPRVALIRNGADYEWFVTRPSGTFSDPSRRRIIGYYGAIAAWFDTEIVAHLAERFPECLILLVGADTANAEARLRRYRNVRFAGEVPYRRLPSYLHAFDVAIMPFRPMPLTEATNPVKIYEYLAAGKPVVTTGLPEVAQFGDLVRQADSPAAFVEAVAQALIEGPKDAEAARAFARSNTWAQRVAAFSDAVAAVPRPRISIVIVAFNQMALTKLCLASIAARAHYENLEVIVVDNNSRDGTGEYLRAWAKEAPGRRAIVSDINLGFAGGVNRGLVEATGDVLIVMNNDVVVTDGFASTLASHLQRDPQLGLVGPVTNAIGNEARVDISYPSLDAMPAAARQFTAARLGKLLPLRTLAFFCVAMRRDVYERIGPLDERFGPGYFEDDDYCRRVEAAGYSIACAEDVFVHHEHSASFDALGETQRTRLFAENRRKYEEKWGQWQPHTYRSSE